MAIEYATISQRIGKWKAEIHAYAKYAQTLFATGPQIKDMPKNNSMETVFRSWLPYGDVQNKFVAASTSDAAAAFANKHILQEGQAPSADSITPVDVSVTLQEYGMLYSFSNRTYDFHEDNIPAEITRQLGERKGTLDEMIDYAALQACTTKLYAGNGGSRATVSKAPTLAGLRAIARSLYNNSAGLMTVGGKTGPGYGSAAIESGWVVVCHTDVLADFRNMDGWIPVQNYAGVQPIHPMEKGSVEEFRIIVTPHLQPILDAGALVGVTGLKANSTNVDVYQTIVAAKDAWGKLALTGTGSISPKIHMPDSSSKSDPLGQTGLHGMRFYAASKVLNQGWMCVYEHGSTALSSSY